MLTLFDDTELFNSGYIKISHFNIPGVELTLYEHFFNRKTMTCFAGRCWMKPPISGSPLPMAEPMQHFWEHQILKTSKEIISRINPTYRIVQ